MSGNQVDYKKEAAIRLAAKHSTPAKENIARAVFYPSGCRCQLCEAIAQERQLSIQEHNLKEIENGLNVIRKANRDYIEQYARKRDLERLCEPLAHLGVDRSFGGMI